MHMSAKLMAIPLLALGLTVAAGVPMAQATSAKGAKTALDPNARILACYKEVTVPAKYDIKKVLVSKAHQKYLRKGGLVYLVEYPAVYREDKTLKEPEHIVMREVACKTRK